MGAAVAMVIFNRADRAARVFERVAQARPERLFVIADGPRPDHPGEDTLCAETRAVTEAVDWDCEVFRRYSDVNRGCGYTVSAGVTWVFEHVEAAIVLEDDCLPDPTFFPFCDELLERYRDDERIMVVSGNNFDPAPTEHPYSYGVQRNYSTWGWATWRRAWQHMDMSVSLWPLLRDTPWLLDIQGTDRGAAFWREIFDKAFGMGPAADRWTFDYQWYFSCWAQNGLGLVPRTNLVTNIGFGAGATNTSSADSPLADYPVEPMTFPLVHPPVVARDLPADVRTFDFAFAVPRRPDPGPLGRARRRTMAALPHPVRTRLRAARHRRAQS